MRLLSLLSLSLQPVLIFSSDTTFTPSEFPTPYPTLTPVPSEFPTPYPTMTTVPTLLPSPSPTFAPTASPSNQPTRYPSLSPSSFPSISPSISPTEAPTTSPSLSPSSIPSSSPSHAPSSPPTLTPTVIPTRIPPTTRPTRVPTVFPTFQPSAPTVRPTSLPTPLPKAPTFVPTPAPTGEPTSAPTASTVIEMQVSQELSGVSADDFNSDPAVSASFTQSVAEAMGIDSDSVEILGVTESNSTSRRLLGLGGSGGGGGGLRLSFLSRPEDRKLGSVTLTVDYAVVLVMQSLGYQDADEAVSQLKQSIEDSVSTGEFTEILKTVSSSLSVSILNNVTAATVAVKKVVLSYNSASPTLHPTSQPSAHRKPSSDSAPGLSGGGLIGVIVAAAVVSLVFVGFLLYYALVFRKNILVTVNPVGGRGQESQFSGAVPSGVSRQSSSSLQVQVQPRAINL